VVRSFLRSLVLRSFVPSLLRPCVRSFVSLFIHSAFRSFVRSFVFSWFVQVRSCSFILSFVRPYVHDAIRRYTMLNTVSNGTFTCRRLSTEGSTEEAAMKQTCVLFSDHIALVDLTCA
jgi:hypothetical protein